MNKKKMYAALRSFFTLFVLIAAITGLKAWKVQAASAPGKPALKKVEATAKGVKLTWGKSENASGYYVYRKTGTGKYQTIATIKSASTVSYVDTKVKSGTTYRYSVRAYRGSSKSAYNTTGLKITYLTTPVIQTAKVSNGTVKLTWKASPKASGYYIYRKKSGGLYTRIASVKSNVRSYTDKKGLSQGKYVYAVRAYKDKYLSGQGIKNCNVQNYSIENTPSSYSIEADVTLSGTGTGYHAKLVACTETSALSFGIQYDMYGKPPYTDKTMFLVENVFSNAPGQQVYTRHGQAARNKSFHLMLSVMNDGTCNCYVDGVKVGSVKNPNLANQTVYLDAEGSGGEYILSERMNAYIHLRVEASGRKNGDTVKAVFKNIKVKGGDEYNAAKRWETIDYTTNAGIKSDASKYRSSKTITINGKVVGLTPAQDWDNAYESVSGIIQLNE